MTNLTTLTELVRKTIYGEDYVPELDRSKHNLLCNVNTFATERSCNCEYPGDPVSTRELWIALTKKSDQYCNLIWNSTDGYGIAMSGKDFIPIPPDLDPSDYPEELLEQLIGILK